MTSAQVLSFTTPPDIERFLILNPCPICGENLIVEIDTENITFGDQTSRYSTRAKCLDIYDCYYIDIEYEDPKKILKTTEIVHLEEDEWWYVIIFERNLDTLRTDIEVWDDNDKPIKLSFRNEKVLDLSKFNKKQWIRDIKIWMMLE